MSISSPQSFLYISDSDDGTLGELRPLRGLSHRMFVNFCINLNPACLNNAPLVKLLMSKFGAINRIQGAIALQCRFKMAA